MEMIRKIFPYSFKVKGLLSLIVTVIIYLVIGAVLAWIFGLLHIPFLGWIIDLYPGIGIILAVLRFFKIV